MEDNKILEIVKTQTEEFLTQLGLEGDIGVNFMEADSKEEVAYRYVLVEMEGEHLTELIGFHGKMLEATQNVLGLFLNKVFEQRNIQPQRCRQHPG